MDDTQRGMLTAEYLKGELLAFSTSFRLTTKPPSPKALSRGRDHRPSTTAMHQKGPADAGGQKAHCVGSPLLTKWRAAGWAGGNGSEEAFKGVSKWRAPWAQPHSAIRPIFSSHGQPFHLCSKRGTGGLLGSCTEKVLLGEGPGDRQSYFLV